MIQAVTTASVPKITIILRKCHGAAVWAMGGRPAGSDSPELLVAWPIATMTGTGPESAVNTVHHQEIQESNNPEALRKELEEHYRKAGSAYRAAEVLGIDDIIEPKDTRRFLIDGLEMACSKLMRQLGKRHMIYP